MAKYHMKLMQDMRDRPNDWTNIRSCHGVFLTMLENGDIRWKSKRKIADLKQCYIYNHRPSQAPSHTYSASQGQTKSTDAGDAKTDKVTIPCPAYNKGSCPFDSYHGGLHHICAHCLREKAKFHKHPETTCFALVGVPARGVNVNRI